VDAITPRDPCIQREIKNVKGEQVQQDMDSCVVTAKHMMLERGGEGKARQVAAPLSTGTTKAQGQKVQW